MKVNVRNLSQPTQLTLELEELIEAPRERVFTALIDEMSEWFPHRFVEGAPLKVDVNLLGGVGEDWGNGDGIRYSLITAYRKPELVCETGFGTLFGNWIGQTTFRLKETEGGTIVTVSIWTVGMIGDELADMYTNGWPGLFEELRKHLGVAAKQGV